MAVKEWFRRLQPVQLYLVLFFTAAFFIIEMIASHVTHSLTLLLNGYHMLCNIIALVGCIASIKYGNQGKCRGDSKCSTAESKICLNKNEKGSVSSLPSDSKHSCSDRRMKNTFGWARIDILTMLVCCVFLASFCFSLLVEALQTLIHIDHLDAMHHPVPVMCIGISGILLNAFCFIIIGGYTFNQGLYINVMTDVDVILQRDLSGASPASAEQRLAAPIKRSPMAIPRRPGFQEIFRDVLGCILVIIGSILVHFNDQHIAKFIDPIFAIIASISLFILSYPYLRESCLILLQTIPNHINIDSLKKELLAAFPGIVNVHDLHVWQLAGEKIISTVHIIFFDQMVYANISDQVTAFFVEMGITQVTIQPEFHKMKPNVDNTDCLIRCRGKRCIESQCCSKDDLLNEIITNKSEKQSSNISKKYVNKEIIPSESTIDLKKFTLNKSNSTKMACRADCSQDSNTNDPVNNKSSDNSDYYRQKSIYKINVDVNYSVETMKNEETVNSVKL